MSHLQIVLSILRENKLYVKRSKCSFGQVQVENLGHIISKGVATDPQKVQCMIDWPRPTTTKALRGFLGFTGYYRRFVRGYRHICAPLTALLKKDGFAWNAEAELAFETLKKAMVSTPVLALPDFSQQFVIECDASRRAIGAVLMQGRWPIAFINKVLPIRSKGISTYEKEMEAIVFAVTKWRPYLVGRKLLIRTDHRSIKYMDAQRASTPAQQWWLSKLMGYTYEIMYKTGAKESRSKCIIAIYYRSFFGSHIHSNSSMGGLHYGGMSQQPILT
ncbi:hypothetical protein HHK36_000821 [Tetracentron sinense]|uniref:Reverse transcriptase/retrotransposon-derived protein RNase H-like domain-containing protein n=1 Tax=Tetracentron sinense TaxID=13715 RepID=A0A835DU74_TETSI|nr:hypothetical protein HHK36_000821 [Tetracentron sinense]